MEEGTKDEMMVSTDLNHGFTGSQTTSSTHTLEKCFENPPFVFCSSFQQNHRLETINFESQDDDSMAMCMSNSQDDDSMTMCMSNSQDDDSMTMCMSNSQDNDSMR